MLGTYYICYTVGGTAYYFNQPAFSFPRLEIPWGTKITAYETSVTGWVSFDSVSGHTGYIEIDQLTTVALTNIVNAGTRYINCSAGKSIKLSMEPKAGSSQWPRPFCRGHEFQAYTIGSTGWSAVLDPSGYCGYCLTSNLTTTKPTMIGVRYVNAPSGEIIWTYAEASTGAEQLFGVQRGQQVNVYDGGSTEWALIQNIPYPWNMGYIKASYLTTSNPPALSYLGTRYINYPYGYPTWLYSEPTAASTSICSLERGTQVTAYSIGNDQWTYIVAPSGQAGYCYTSRLSINQPKAIIASLGEKYIDVPVGYAIYAYDEPSSSANRTFNNARGAKIKAFDIGMADWLCFQSSATVQEGYMPKAYVSDYEVRTGTSIGTRYANIISSYSFGLYKYSNTASGVRHNLLGGTAVTVYDVGVSGWKLVQSASGLFGYCYDYYLASNPPGAGTNLGTRFVDVASGSTLPVYASCSAGTTIGNLNPGTEVHAFDCSVANFVYIRTKAAPIVEGFCRTASLSTTPPGSGNNGLLSAVANTWSVQIWNDENRTGSPSFVSPSTGRMPFTVKEYGNMAMYKTYHGFYPLSEKYVMKSVIDLVENGERTAGQRIADIVDLSTK